MEGVARQGLSQSFRPVLAVCVLGGGKALAWRILSGGSRAEGWAVIHDDDKNYIGSRIIIPVTNYTPIFTFLLTLAPILPPSLIIIFTLTLTARLNLTLTYIRAASH